MATATTQKMTARHILIVLTCVLCTFGCAAITFSCPGLCYKPVANWLTANNVADFLGIATSAVSAVEFKSFNDLVAAFPELAGHEDLYVQVFNVSFYMTVVYLAEVIFSPIIGALLEKFDVRIICTVAAVFTSAGIACMSFYTELWQWYVSGFFMGIGEITLLWLMVAGLLNRWFKAKLGLMLGISYAMTGLGGAFFNFIGQGILGGAPLYAETWRELYLFYGIAAAVLSVPFTLFAIRSHPQDCGLKAYGATIEEGETINAENLELPGIPAKVAYTKWYFWVLVIAGCLFNVGGIYPQHFTTFYQTVVAVDSITGEQIKDLMAMSGTLEACCMIGMAVGKVTIGAIESRNVVVALAFGSICGFVGLIGIWYGGFNVTADNFDTLPLLFFGGFIFGMLYPLVTTVLPYITRLLFGEKDYDKIYSVILMPVNLVGAFAASGLALIYQNPDLGWNTYFIVGLIVAVLCFIFGYVVVKWGTKDYRGDKAAGTAH